MILYNCIYKIISFRPNNGFLNMKTDSQVYYNGFMELLGYK